MKRLVKKQVFALLLLLSLLPLPLSAKNEKTYPLDEIIALALEKNPDVPAFAANLEAAKGEIISSGAYPNPEIELENGKGIPFEEEAVSRWEYVLSFSQPIERSKKRFYRKKTKETEFLALQHEKENFLLDLRAEVKAAFYLLLLNNKQVELS